MSSEESTSFARSTARPSANEGVAPYDEKSIPMIQRRLRVGYTRAGRLIDMLERRGIISGYEGSKPRQVLISEGDVPRVLAALDERPVAVPDELPPPE